MKYHKNHIDRTVSTFRTQMSTFFCAEILMIIEEKEDGQVNDDGPGPSASN